MIYNNSFDELQENLEIVIPSLGKSIYIWNIIIEGTGNLKFKNTEENIVSINGGSLGSNNIDKQGNVDESIVLNCEANTKVKILFDEV